MLLPGCKSQELLLWSIPDTELSKRICNGCTPHRFRRVAWMHRQLTLRSYLWDTRFESPVGHPLCLQSFRRFHQSQQKNVGIHRLVNNFYKKKILSNSSFINSPASCRCTVYIPTVQKSAHKKKTSVQRGLRHLVNIQSVPREKINILRGHSIGHSKQKKKCICTCVLFRTVSEIEIFQCTVPKLLIRKRYYVLFLILVFTFQVTVYPV
jgi:hypothetical protein